jgi:hypothetical protein
MRVLVTGGRDYGNEDHVFHTLDGLHEGIDPITCLIQGGASGADYLARLWAMDNNIDERITVKAEWEKYGPSAGPRRNEKMLAEYRPDLVVAFPGGKGTAHMVSIAKKAGVRVLEAGEPERK